jgi:hypothetical protein
MPKFFVENLTDRPLKVAIEPWADLEVLAPKSRADFEYQEPGNVEFSVVEGGGVCVGIMSDLIKVTANGGEKTFKPPRGWGSQEVG